MPATDTFWRNLKRMHVVFAASAIALLVATLWMMAKDHADEWRDYQRTFERIEAARLEQEVQEIRGDNEFKTKTEELKTRHDEITKQIEGRPEVKQLEEKISLAQNQADLADRELRNRRAERDVARANYDLGVRDSVPESRLNELRAKYDAEEAAVGKLTLDAQKKQTALDGLRRQLAEETKVKRELEEEQKRVAADIERLDKAYTTIEPSGLSAIKREIMEWPIIDGFNSHLKVEQVWLPNLSVRLGMAETARFDRCQTCHKAIDRVESGNVPAFPPGHPPTDDVHDWIASNEFPHPFATHPNPDLFASASSPHPVATFGCTTCHEGQGSGTSFSTAAHYPDNPHEHEEWEEKYGFATNHFWEYPMNPTRFLESSCIKCHHNVEELGVHPEFGASAPKVHRGYEVLKKYGCFGCHEINGHDAGRQIGPDIRLEPSSDEERAKYAADPTLIPGDMRKVGPALTHISSKTTQDWVEYWTEEPKRFRPDTRMPQFFKLSNLEDAHAVDLQPVEIAGVAQFLMNASTPLETIKPADGYVPDAERGRVAFSQRGCLACHTHEEFPTSVADFGPNLSRVREKIKPGHEPGGEGFNWLYSWIMDPTLHDPRTRMPDTKLEVETVGDVSVDPAADIAAFLLQHQPSEKQIQASEAVRDEMQLKETIEGKIAYEPKALDDLVKLYLSKSLTNPQVEETMTTRKYPFSREMIKGDEIELTRDAANVDASPEEWERMKLNYIGRRTISRYGCYGCHDINGFENAKPIGTALQDWGRKDTSRLAFEHIEEFLHHHGEPDGSSTADRVHGALQKAAAGGVEAGEFTSEEQAQEDLGAAFFYESLLHHGRPGFIWQKLRDPRSYDYMKTETKGYDERLRMPKFPFDQEEIEAVATFVLGLVADPPAPQYVYQPEGAELARIEGEKLITKFNCTGCHMLDMPTVRYGVNPEEVLPSELTPGEHPEALPLLLALKPPADPWTGETREFMVEEEKTKLPIFEFEGLVSSLPDPEDDPEFQEYGFDLWETLKLAGDQLMFPSSRITVPASRLVGIEPGRGGEFAEWLVDLLMETTTDGNRQLAWQMAPPPLYKEGIKVQTDWLYHFLREPHKLRHTTTLRMPKFNLSSDEARILANYFAAVDGAPYPYEAIPQREGDYLAMRSAETEQLLEGEPYLTEAWHVLNAPLCIKCHSLAGREFQASDPQKDIRGPNLEFVSDRLRPDWLMLWLFKPQWITPYTSMPQPYLRGGGTFPELFEGDATQQTIATRDALMNYNRLMERIGKQTAEAQPAPAPDETNENEEAASPEPAQGEE